MHAAQRMIQSLLLVVLAGRARCPGEGPQRIRKQDYESLPVSLTPKILETVEKFVLPLAQEFVRARVDEVTIPKEEFWKIVEPKKPELMTLILKNLKEQVAWFATKSEQIKALIAKKKKASQEVKPQEEDDAYVYMIRNQFFTEVFLKNETEFAKLVQSYVDKIKADTFSDLLNDKSTDDMKSNIRKEGISISLSPEFKLSTSIVPLLKPFSEKKIDNWLSKEGSETPLFSFNLPKNPHNAFCTIEHSKLYKQHTPDFEKVRYFAAICASMTMKSQDYTRALSTCLSDQIRDHASHPVGKKPNEITLQLFDEYIQNRITDLKLSDCLDKLKDFEIYKNLEPMKAYMPAVLAQTYEKDFEKAADAKITSEAECKEIFEASKKLMADKYNKILEFIPQQEVLDEVKKNWEQAKSAEGYKELVKAFNQRAKLFETLFAKMAEFKVFETQEMKDVFNALLPDLSNFFMRQLDTEGYVKMLYDTSRTQTCYTKTNSYSIFFVNVKPNAASFAANMPENKTLGFDEMCAQTTNLTLPKIFIEQKLDNSTNTRPIIGFELHNQPINYTHEGVKHTTLTSLVKAICCKQITLDPSVTDPELKKVKYQNTVKNAFRLIVSLNNFRMNEKEDFFEISTSETLRNGKKDEFMQNAINEELKKKNLENLMFPGMTCSDIFFGGWVMEELDNTYMDKLKEAKGVPPAGEMLIKPMKQGGIITKKNPYFMLPAFKVVYPRTDFSTAGYEFQMLPRPKEEEIADVPSDAKTPGMNMISPLAGLDTCPRWATQGFALNAQNLLQRAAIRANPPRETVVVTENKTSPLSYSSIYGDYAQYKDLNLITYDIDIRFTLRSMPSAINSMAKTAQQLVKSTGGGKGTNNLI